MKILKNEQSFTLIELLIVIGIIAVLAVAVVVVMNPMEYFKKSRDSTRMSELQTINKALGQYLADGKTYLGLANKVYVSIPDSSTTCVNLGLPSLPTGWEYRCSNSANYRKVDSTGWIPVPFTSISFGSNLAILPIDPINTTSTGNYYTYVMGGSYKLTALFESERYKMGGSMDKTSKDNGSYPELLEIGTNLTLLPVSRNPSLVGYWKFNETSGTNAYDASGRGNNGTLTNGPTWTTGKVGGALSFDGVDDYVDAGNAASLNITGEITLEAWIYTTTYAYPTNEGMIVNKENSYEFAIQKTTGALIAAIKDSNPWAWRGSIVVPLNQWKHLTITYAANVEKHYIDSILVESFALSGGLQGSAQGLRISARGAPGTPTSFFNGIIDEVRIYNRALSAAEISAIYNATQ